MPLHEDILIRPVSIDEYYDEREFRLDVGTMQPETECVARLMMSAQTGERFATDVPVMVHLVDRPVWPARLNRIVPRLTHLALLPFQLDTGTLKLGSVEWWAVDEQQQTLTRRRRFPQLIIKECGYLLNQPE